MFIRNAVSTLVVAGLALAVGLATMPAAYADDGGAAVRHGRFVWHKPALKEKAVSQPSTASVQDTRVVYDKGDLGKYVRHGRFVTKVSTVGTRSSAGKTDYAKAMPRHKVSNDFKRPTW